MEFQSQRIVLQALEGPQTVDAIVGIGSGLAYHLEEGENDEPIYVLTHLLSGRSLSGYGVEGEDVAQRWLELVAALTDWNQGMETLRIEYPGGEVIRDQAHAAIDQAYEDVAKEFDDQEDEM